MRCYNAYTTFLFFSGTGNISYDSFKKSSFSADWRHRNLMYIVTKKSLALQFVFPSDFSKDHSFLFSIFPDISMSILPSALNVFWLSIFIIHKSSPLFNNQHSFKLTCIIGCILIAISFF